MKIIFYKYQATGNDFVLLDNRDGKYDVLRQGEIARICDRRFGVGGDGLIRLKDRAGYDFEMQYFNADGAVGSMCGNGGRCIARFAQHMGFKNSQFHFLAYDGDHDATIGDETVSIRMNPVDGKAVNGEAVVFDTGSPHLILPVSKVSEVDVYSKGKEIRNSEPYKKDGINVNFVEKISDDSIYVRTYERGVENETLSCGTGVTAAALAFSGKDDGKYELKIQTRGGNLSVSYEKRGNHYDNIWLTGPATFVFSGEINI